jgi:23S rRNA pseudouridine1911/1915/1917 synthase
MCPTTTNATPGGPSASTDAAGVLLVDAADGHPRLDTFLRRRLASASRREIHLAVAHGLIRVNGHRSTKGRRVDPGDRIEVGALVASPPSPPHEQEILTLHVDTQILALAKPAGIPSTARRIGGHPSVAGYLLQRMPELASVATSSLDAGLVHRLDTETSGVLLGARTPEAWRALREQFRRKTVDKEYVAVVRGRLHSTRTMVDDLGHDPRRPGAMRVVGHGTPGRHWHAVSTIVPVGWSQHATRVRVRLRTGVTHQIRVQLAAIGHPVWGDKLYDREPRRSGAADRLLLHASDLRMVHPGSGAAFEIHAPLPPDFTAALERLRLAD